MSNSPFRVTPSTFAEIYPSKDGWRFRIKSRNGEIFAHGQVYKHKWSCKATVRLLLGKNALIIEVEK